MPLETLEQPNIKDLAIKSPEKQRGYLFDPYKDIPEEKWREWIAEVNNYRELGEWVSWSYLAANLKIMRPDRAEELRLDEDALNFMLYEIDRADTHVGPRMRCARILFPSSQKVKEKMTAARWQSLRAKVDIGNIAVVVENGSDLAIASPENASRLELPQEYITELMSRVAQEEDEDQKIYLLAKLRILFPAMDMKEARSLIRGPGLIKFGFSDTYDFANLAIISADKVVVDDTGLHLEFNHERKAPTEEDPSPPTNLKF